VFFCRDAVLHNLGDDHILARQLFAQRPDLLFELFRLRLAATVRERRNRVLRQLLLPAIENRRLQAVLLTQIGDRNSLDQMLPENAGFLLRRKLPATLPHDAALRSAQTLCVLIERSRRISGEAKHLHVPRRATEPHGENGRSAIDAANKRFLKEAGEPDRGFGLAFLALQPYACSPDASGYSGDGSEDRGPRLGMAGVLGSDGKLERPHGKKDVALRGL
jgi:hypothetical protein